MKGRQHAIGKGAHQWVMQMVDVKVQYVELIQATVNIVEHHDVIGRHVPYPGIKTQSCPRAWHQP
jgi:hypothetical protein